MPEQTDNPGAEQPASANPPKLPFLLRKAGESRVLQSPLTLEQAEARLALYQPAGRPRSELARVQGRVIVARRLGRRTQLSAYRRYLLGVQTTALCHPHATPNGTLVVVQLAALRYRRLYTVGTLLAIVVAIFVFAPATTFWMRSLLAFGVLLVASSWRFSRETKETRAEKTWLAEFVRNLLDAEEITAPPRRAAREPALAASTTKGPPG